MAGGTGVELGEVGSAGSECHSQLGDSIIRSHQASRLALTWITVVAAAMVLGTCRDATGPRPTYLTPLGNVTSNPPEIFVGAGDIADCDDPHDESTAALLDGIAGTVFTAGDNAYDDGTLTEYNTCYGPNWGRHKARTRPTPGNHEYNTSGAAGYFAYYGAAAGQAGKGFYSFDLGYWHIVALNNYVPMGSGSEQLNWLVADLAATTKPCILGYYHEPLYSSQGGTGSGGTSTIAVRPLFQALYDAGADLVVNGHRHFYERLSPMDPQGQLDLTNGVRTFIVGTGGSAMANPTNAHPLSEHRFGDGNHGVLKFYLYSDSYAWKFVPRAGKTLTDSGSVGCRGVSSGVSPSQSTVTASPSVVPVGGTSTITVTVKNASGQPIPGATVELSVSPADGATLTQPAVPTGTNGVATGSIRADDAVDKVVSATVTLAEQTTPLNQTAQVVVSASSFVVHTLLTAGNNPTNQKVFVTAPIAPAANALVTVAVLGRNASGASPSPIVTGGGMTTWTEVGTATFDSPTTPTRRLTIYRAMSASPGSGPLTITFAGTQGNAQWIVSQWSGVDVSGTNGSGAVLQVGSTNGESVTSLNVGLSPFANANNVAYGAFGVTRNTAVVNPGAGFTEISEQPSGESTPGDLQAEWRANDNTVDASWGTLSLKAGAVALEIKALAGVGENVVDASLSSLTAEPTTIAAGSATTITVTARNPSGAPVVGAVVQLSATGSGNTLSTPAPTNSEGVTTATLSSSVAETKVITATANGTTIAQQASVQVTTGVVSPTLSTVSATPTTILPGGQAATITVVVKDQFDNPISGAAVTLSASPDAGVTFIQPGTTDASGAAAGDMSSAVAELKTITATVTIGGVTTALTQTATVNVTPQSVGAITHTLLTAGNDPTNLRTYTTASIAPAANTLITLAVLGRNPNGASPSPVVTGGGMQSWTEVGTATFDTRTTPTRRLTIYRAMSAAPGSGPLTITFAGSQQGNAQWIVSQWSGVDVSGTNGSGAIVQVGNTNGDAVAGLNVALNAFENANNVAYGAFGVARNAAVVNPGAGFTEISEQPSGESTPGDLQAQWTTNDATIDATWSPILNAAAVGLEIRAGATGTGSAVDPDESTISVSPPEITPGGAASTVEVTARDANGAPLPGVVITLFSTGTGNTLSAPGPTDIDGDYQGSFTSTKAETKVITATARLGSVTTPLNGSAIITVVPGAPSASQSTLTADPLSIEAGSATSTITVHVKDPDLNPISGATVTLSATGSGNTLSGPGTTDANGTFTGTLSSTVAEAKVVSALVDVAGSTTAITQTATVTVQAQPLDGTLSTITAQPLTIVAGNGGSDITVTVRNGVGQPVSGATVELSATGSGNTLSAPGVTDVNGVYNGTLSSTVAGEKVVSATASKAGASVSLTSTVTIGVQPGAVSASQSSLVATAPDVGIGQASAVTVTVRDGQNNPIPGASVELAATGTGNTLSAPGTTDAAGVYTGSLSSTDPGDKVVSATVTVGGNSTLITQTATITVRRVASATLSTILAAPTQITAGSGTSTVTVTARDAQNQPIAGASVQLFVSGTGNTVADPGLTDENGVYVGGFSSTVAANKTVTAAVTFETVTTVLSDAALVTVDPGPVSASQSTISASPGSISSYTGSSTITVTVLDALNNPIPGATVELFATGSGNTLSAPGLTGADGVYTGTLSSSVAETKTVTASATISGATTTLNGSSTVDVITTVSASLSTLQAEPPSITTQETSTFTATVRDDGGQPVSGAVVEFLVSGTGNTIGQPAGPTGGDGVATGTFTSTKAELKTVSARATLNGTTTTFNATVGVTVNPGPVSASQSTISASPGSISSHTGSSTITVTVLDALNNPIPGATVELFATGSGNTLSAPGLTGADGVYTGTLSSSVAETKTVTASATISGATTTLNGSSTVDVITTVSASLSTLQAEPPSITTQETSTLTATVRDDGGQPVSGAVVEFLVSGTGNTIGQPSGPTGGDGVATGTFTSTKAELKTVSARATLNGTTTTFNATVGVTVNPGPVSATFSTIAAIPSTISRVTGTSQITVTARDANDNLISDATVELAATGTGNTLSAPGLTDASGVYTGSLTSTDAEDKVVSASVTVGATTTALTGTVTVTVLSDVATISHTLLTAGNQAVNQRFHTTASISPAPNTLVTLAVLGRNPLGASPDPIVSGGGMATWTVMGSVTFDSIGTPTRRLTIYRAMSPSPGSGPISITFDAAQGNAQWIVSQWDGVEITGTNGSDAIAQIGSANANAVNGLTVPLAVLAHAHNVAYGAFGVNKNVAIVTPGPGFTEISEQPSGESTPGDLQAEWAVNLNTISASWTGLLNTGGMGLEIRARNSLLAMLPSVGPGFSSAAGGTPGSLATNLNPIVASWINLNGGALGIEIKARTN